MSELPTPSLPETQQAAPISIPPSFSPEPQPHPAQKNNKRFILMGGAALVGVGAIGGLVYASWAGYLPNPLAPRPSIESVISAFENISTAQANTSLHVIIGPREADVAPLDFSIFTQGQQASSLPVSLSMLPSDLDLSLSLDTAFTKMGENADGEAHIAGTYTGNNITANVDLTLRSVNGITYIKPDAIPLPLPIFDLNSLSGKWISFGKEEDRDVFSAKKTEEKTKEVSDANGELIALIKQGVQDGSIIFSVPTRVTHNGTRLWETNLTIDGEKLSQTIATIGASRDTLFPGVTSFSLFTDDLIEANGKERSKDIYRELFARTSLTLLIDDHSVPVVASINTRIAPALSNNVLKDRQVTFTSEITLSHVNETTTVSAPENALSASEAGGLLLGMSAEKIQQSAQMKTVEDLRDALEIYAKDHEESYPSTLNDLMGVQKSSRTVTYIPNDLITKAPYIYTSTGTSYTLVYQSPTLTEEESASSKKAVAGTNTATPDFVSQEAAQQTDKDKDGLSAFDENTYDTNDLKADTDGDGYDDKAEVDAGYNPTGEGLLLQE